jgi:glucose-6-phosphate 1-epimerase
MPARTDDLLYNGAMEKIEIVAADGACVQAYTQGAHVTSWKPASGEERLFLSARSAYEPGVTIRGGVPVVFPQFSSQGPLLKHGFARIMEWECVRAGRTSTGKGEAQFRLTSSPHTREIWDHAFDASVVVTVGGMSMTIALSVLNIDRSAFSFTAALHTYLLVEDVRGAAVLGLEGMSYRDAAAGGIDARQGETELRVAGELDRIYYDVTAPLEVRDAVRSTRISMAGFTDVVVWNPGAERAAALTDMEPGGWLRMLCVEAAVVGKPVQLEPEQRWTGQQTFVAG